MTCSVALYLILLSIKYVTMRGNNSVGLETDNDDAEDKSSKQESQSINEEVPYDEREFDRGKMCRMSMKFSRVKIIHAESISAIQPITTDDNYTLARLQKNALKYTIDEDPASVDDIAADIASMLYGDTSGPMLCEGSLRLDIAGHVAAALVTVLENDTNVPLITYAMTHRLHKRNGCMSVLMRVAFSALKMAGHDSCAVYINENNVPVREYFLSFGFAPDD